MGLVVMVVMAQIPVPRKRKAGRPISIYHLYHSAGRR